MELSMLVAINLSIYGSTTFSLNWYSGRGEVQLGPLGTAATNRPIMIMMIKKLVELWLAGDTEIIGVNLPQCSFVHHKPHMLPGREPGSPRWEESDQPLELRHGLSTTLCWTLSAVSASWSFTQSVGLLGRGMSPSQGRYLHTENRTNTE
jgi:hypothetical protein